MTELVYTAQALMHLERLSDCLRQADPRAAQDTAILIFDALEVLVRTLLDGHGHGHWGNDWIYNKSAARPRGYCVISYLFNSN